MVYVAELPNSLVYIPREHRLHGSVVGVVEAGKDYLDAVAGH
jgi:hypothetical protein